MSKRQTIGNEARPWKLLLWTAVAGLILGLIFGDLERWPRTARNSLHWHKASGDIVLVKIDSKSLRDVGRWPWPRRYNAEITDRLNAAGAKRIFFDISFFGSTNPADDRAFAEAMQRSGRVVLGARTRSGPQGGTELEGLPLPVFAKAAHGLATISWRYDFQQAVTDIPYAMKAHGQVYPSFASLLSGADGSPESMFVLDYSVDPNSIPAISAASILDRSVDLRAIKGKAVVIGWTAEELGDQFFVPGTGRMGGAYVHIIGAETLKGGRPVDLGLVPLYLLALAAGALALTRRDGRQQVAILGVAASAVTLGPALPEAYHIFLNGMAG